MSRAEALAAVGGFTALLGWTAAGLVLATFCCKRMVSLRVVAIASNLAFAGYGCLAHLWPILALHLVMLPLNTWRLRGALVEGRANCPASETAPAGTVCAAPPPDQGIDKTPKAKPIAAISPPLSTSP